MRSFLRTGVILLVLLVLFCTSGTGLFDASRPAGAQAATPAALPSGIDLGLDRLVYVADFTDSGAWPTVSTRTQPAFVGDGKGTYHASSAGITDPVWGPSTAYSGRDYYAELAFDLETCGSQGTIYFLVRMSQPRVIDGNSFAYSLSCDGKLEARRLFGGELRADSSMKQGSPPKPGRHTIGVLSVGSTGRWFVDGREVGTFDNVLMAQSGRVGIGVSGTVTFDIQQLRIWTLAADALPTGTGKLIYDADFVTDSQWPQGLGESALTRTADEVYLLTTIADTKPFVALSGHPGGPDVVVQLIFEPRRCETPESSIGIIFRATKTRAYAFALECGGTYFVAILVPSDTRPSIDRYGVNRPLEPFAGNRSLAVLVKGSDVTLFIDGKQVAQLTVENPEEPSDAGVFAYSAPDSIQVGIRAFSVWAAP